VNGHVVKDAHNLAKQIGSMTPGAAVKLTVWRKGEEKSFSLTLGELPRSKEARATNLDSEATGAGLPKLGMTVAPAEEVAGSGSEGVVEPTVRASGVLTRALHSELPFLHISDTAPKTQPTGKAMLTL
jgi:serine protease Do